MVYSHAVLKETASEPKVEAALAFHIYRSERSGTRLRKLKFSRTAVGGNTWTREA